MRTLRSLTLAGLCLISRTAAAEAPNLIHYQGYLTDDLGGPVADGNYAVTFSIHTLPAGGALLWTEATNQTTVSGRFNHFLGSVTALPADLFNINDSLFLQLTVVGETLSPRTRLVSVGYTRRVNSVAGALGGDVTGEVTVAESSSVAFVTAVHGILTSPTPGSSAAALRGENQGTTASGYGVWGSHDGDGSGVYGSSIGGRGVYGAANGGVGGYFKSFGASPTALYVETTAGVGDAAQFKDGDVVLLNAAGTQTIELDPHEGSAGGHISLFRSDSTRTMTLDAAENGRSQVSLYHTDGTTETVELLGTQVSDSTGGIITLRNTRNNVTVQIDGEEGSTGGQILLQTTNGVGTVEIDGEFGAGGQGRMTINGSSDADLSTPHSGYVLLGTPAGTNIIMDDNEIMARDGSLPSPLHLQHEQGQVVIGGLGAANLPSDYILLVDGKAILEEVEVQLSTVWPDYVFEEDYDLLPLSRLEEHVKSQKHLPGMPTAADMEEAPLPLGEMQTKLLEKVEELTLYVIGLKHELDAVRADNGALEQQLASLRAAQEGRP